MIIALLTINLSIIFETLILGIAASLIATIAFELWKRRRKRFHISIALDSCEVYASQEKSDVRIQVDYKGKAVENALVIMYVSIINDGQEDLMFKSHFSDSILISCEDFEFLSISAEDNRVAPDCILNEDGTASLSWDILKSGELIQLCIAAHSKNPIRDGLDGVDCYNKLSFDFRSDCIDTMAVSKEMTQQEASRKNYFNRHLYVYTIFIAASLGMLLYDMSFSSRYDIFYDGQPYENATLLYSPLFKKYILSSDTAKTKILSLDNIAEIKSITPTEYKNAANWISALLEAMILIMVILSVFSIIMNRIAYSNHQKGYLTKRKCRR